ncbi:non-homologous end joining protein Ku [Streptomyces sp. PTD5-9]|uniref:non-homologous end joining protein Ku n=1 Tax=Streptomyces sp. PTD5-9 TaxID=3120150 RepID=UPI00300A593E
MRSIWNGAISFGLVSIPIKLVNATESHSISFRQIHLADGGRIRYRKVCELDEQEVDAAEIGKAYEDADGSLIPISDEELGSLPLPTAKTIEIVAFVPAASIDPLQMDAAYYLSANGVPAAKPYTLLREALKRSQKVALAKYALRGRERLGMLRVVDDVIAMHGLLWPDEIRSPEGVAPEADVTVRDAELDLADALMDTLGEVDMDSLHDDYREAVEELIAAKAEGRTLEPERPADSGRGKVIDLVAALEKSVRAAKEARGEEAEPAEGERGEREPGEAADRPMAGVTSLTGRKKPGAARPRKKTAAPAGKAAAKKPKSTTGRAPAKKSASRSTAKKSASAKAASAKPASAKATAKKTTAKSGAEPAAGRTAARKRASA